MARFQATTSKVETKDIYILTTTVRVTETARDLGVVMDYLLSLSAHVSAVIRCGYYQLRQLRTVMNLLSEDASKTVIPCIQIVPPGLLQFVALRHHRQAAE